MEPRCLVADGRARDRPDPRPRGVEPLLRGHGRPRVGRGPRYGAGLEFDGVEGWLDCGDLGIPANGTATVEGWFSRDQMVVDRNMSAAGMFSQLYQYPVNERLHFRTGADSFRVATLLTADVWHHVVLVQWRDGHRSIVPRRPRDRCACVRRSQPGGQP